MFRNRWSSRLPAESCESDMNAKEARQITEIYQHPDIEMLVAEIDLRIEEAAKHGLNHVTEPDLGHPMGQITPNQMIALRKHYESRGFKWQISKQTSHPCCRGLTTISW